MSIASGNFAKLLEPGQRKIFFETYKEKPEQFSKVFNVVDSKKAVESDMRMSGFDLWTEKGSQDSTEYEDLGPTDTVLYKHKTFSRGYHVEKDLIDDEQYNQINKAPKALARTARATVENLAISVYNGAFTTATTNWKGEALVSSSHALLKGGTTTNSIGSLTLSEANIEVAMKLAREQVDESGILIQCRPSILVVGKSNEFTAKKILNSTLLPGTDYNDINPIKGIFDEVVVLDYLTDDGRWFLIDPTLYQVNFFWRERLNFKADKNFDTDVAKYKGRMRFSYGWTDHRGVLGSKPS